jgi:hypothetical protein
MFGLIIMVMLFWFTRKTIYIHLTLFTLILMTGNALVNDIKRQRQCGISVFNIRDELLIRFYQGTRAVTIYGNGNPGDFSILTSQQKLLKDHQDGLGIQTNRQIWGGSALQSLTMKNGFIPLFGRSGSFIFKGSKIYILKTKIPKHLKISHPVDIIIITGNPSLKMAEVQRIFSPETVVLDGTNSYFRRQRWIREGDSLGMKIHSVADCGAFKIELNLVYPLPAYCFGIDN